MTKIKKKLLLGVGISLLFIIGITLYTIDTSTWNTLNNLNINYLLLIVLATISAWTLNGLKLKVLAAGVKVKLPIFTAVELGLVDRFFSNITPSGIGGQPAKIIALTNCNISSGKASAIVVVELMLRLLFFAFCLPFIFIKIHSLLVSTVNIGILYFTVPLLIATLAVVIYLLLYKPRYLVKIFFGILNLSLVSKLLSSKKIFSAKKIIAKEIKEFYQTLWIYLKEGSLELITGIFITALLWLVRFTILYFVIKGFNLKVDFGFIILIQLIIYTAVLFIPIPGGSGVEVILASLLHKTLPVPLIGIVVASWRFFTYYVYIIFGSIVTYRVFHLKTDEDIMQDDY